MTEQDFDPTQPSAEKLQAEPVPDPAPDPTGIKARIAALVRADSEGRGAVTAELAIRQLAPALTRQEVSAVLAEMAAEPAYADIRAVVAPSGRLYLFSATHLAPETAQGKGQTEEAKLAIAGRIRADSRRTLLTPAAELEPLLPPGTPGQRAALLQELRSDERYGDLQVLAGPKGEVYYHSDRSLSAAYGGILLRAQAGDACLAVAELVRERSRIMPKPTRLDVFQDPVFGIASGELEAVVTQLLGRTEYADVKRMVHPETGSVYLYSDRHLEARQAFLIMDWDEVGAAQNP